jgi:hypothetical protein
LYVFINIYYPTKENSELNPEISPSTSRNIIFKECGLINILHYFIVKVKILTTLYETDIQQIIMDLQTTVTLTDFIDASTYGMIGVKYEMGMEMR